MAMAHIHAIRDNCCIYAKIAVTLHRDLKTNCLDCHTVYSMRFSVIAFFDYYVFSIMSIKVKAVERNVSFDKSKEES